jgi:hypothetical protein
MTIGIHTDTCSRACQADRTCFRLPRFQACLDTARDNQRPRIHRRAEACAKHLGVMVVSMTAWAREQHLTDADLAILIIEPSACNSYPTQHEHQDCAQTSGFVFSVIHIGEPEAATTGTSLALLGIRRPALPL